MAAGAVLRSARALPGLTAPCPRTAGKPLMRVLSCCRYLLGTWGGGQRRSPSEIIKRGPEGLRRPVACAYGLRRHASQPPGTGKPAGRRQPEAVWHAPAISVLFTGVLRARLTDISLGKHGSQDRWDRALMVREPLAARRGSEGVATRSGYLRRALATAGGPWHGFGGKGSLQSPSVPVGHVGASSLKDGEDVPAFVELESGGPPPVACRVVGVGRPPSHPTKEGDRREQHLSEDQPPCPA